MDEAFTELVSSIYEASIDPAQWPAAMHKTERLVGVFTSHILLCRRGRAEIFATAPGHTDKVFAESYEQHYSNVDPMPAFVMSCPTGEFVTDEDALPKRRFLNSEFYTDWVRPQGMYTCLYSNAFRRQDQAAYLCLTQERGARPVSRKRMRYAGHLLTHIGRAAEIHFRLAESARRSGLMSEALSLNSQEVICVDAHARVLFASPRAELRLRSADGLSESSSGLSAGTQGETIRLRRQITQGFAPRRLSGDSCTLELRRANGKRAISVSIIPAGALRSNLNVADAHVALLVSDSEMRTENCAQLLRERYRLTRAEIRVAEMLLAGYDLKAMAERLEVSLGTVRNQLKSVFQKTDTHRQSSLVGLLLRLPAFERAR